jgi:hypothetical protein
MVRRTIYTRRSCTHLISYTPLDEFFDHTEQEEHGDNHRSLLASQRQCTRNMYDDNYISLLERLHEHAIGGHQRTFERIYSEQTEDIIRHPGQDDYELWRVACRVCCTLLQTSCAGMTKF